MSPAAPTVSVLLLCWNHTPYLEQCIAALAAQDRDGLEILFLDNGSTDGSADLARQLFERHGLTATILAPAPPQGISANFNRLLAAASGDLVAVLSTDDWYEPGYIAAMRRAALADAAAGWFTCGGYYFFDDSGERAKVPDDGFRSGDVLPLLLAGSDPFFFVGCCYRRSALLAVGGWDESLPIEDRDLFLRLAQRYPVRTLSERLVNYRRASSTASAKPDFMRRGFDAFFGKHRAAFGRHWRRRYATALRGPAVIAIDQGKLDLAGKILTRALRLSPLDPLLWRTAAYWLRQRTR
ncbi:MULTISPECIES: glycosyltransferase family 2 protein [Sphingomonas]|uniref:glycosyltransferase family 2 protein n=1 Tax=Sphingomonas TaxID=13687 RepID=UPI0013B45E04|nr:MULTISPECIES: glycosyltransferase [Sphingomonas]